MVFVAGGVGAVVLAVGAWAIFFRGGGEPDAAETQVATVDPLVGGDNAGGSRLDGRRDAPVVIEQGSRSAGNAEPRTAGASEPRTRRPASVPSERPTAQSVADETDTALIPDLVPPPLENAQPGMLDGALSNASRPGVTPETVRPAADAGAASNPPPRQPTKSDVPRSTIASHLEAADTLIERNDPLAARQALWDAFAAPDLSELERSVLRARLTELNNDLVFGPVYRAGDPLTDVYTVQAGDSLSRIAERRGTGTHWRLIQRVNQLSAPERIRVGQTLKLVQGPFHAVVDKSDFRLDLYQGPTEEPDRWVFVRSFDVGLGEGDSTPLGHFIVREDGKLANPGWVNPRNPAEKYTPDDPKNPIGEYWVGLEGLGDAAAYDGYGIHGTIDLQSIGKERSMGCVRMLPDDIALMYEVLSEGRSLVRIKR